MSGRGKQLGKDRAYAEGLAAGMEQLEAYHAAGFKGCRGNASRKANTPEIRLMVESIADARVSALIVDEKWAVREMVKNYYRAVDAKDMRTCQAQLKDIGHHLGMFIDRKDIRIHAKYEQLTDRELLQELEQVTEQLAIADQSEDGEQ